MQVLVGWAKAKAGKNWHVLVTAIRLRLSRKLKQAKSRLPVVDALVLELSDKLSGRHSDIRLDI